MELLIFALIVAVLAVLFVFLVNQLGLPTNVRLAVVILIIVVAILAIADRGGVL